MESALVKDAQDDIDRNQRREYQKGLVGQRCLEGRRSRETAVNIGRAAPSGGLLPPTSRTASPRDFPGARLNETVIAGN